jgi:uncharacterized membrane protein YdbT with pleckstrin-like domain
LCNVPSTDVFVANLLNAFLVLFPDIIIIVIIVVIVVVIIIIIIIIISNKLSKYYEFRGVMK